MTCCNLQKCNKKSKEEVMEFHRKMEEFQDDKENERRKSNIVISGIIIEIIDETILKKELEKL